MISTRPTTGYQFKIPAELERSEAMTAMPTPQPVNPLRAVAEGLSRRGVMAAKCELANNAVIALVDVLFDTDSDGWTANVDADSRIIIPVPWGRNGYRQWGLRVSEMRALNHVMRTRSHTEATPLFVYDEEFRRWYVGQNYGRRSALFYLKSSPIELAEWRAAWRTQKSTWAASNLEPD